MKEYLKRIYITKIKEYQNEYLTLQIIQEKVEKTIK
jgi:hypothetical protein